MLNSNPNLVDERLLSKIKYNLKRPTINSTITTDYNNDYFIVFLQFIKMNLGIFIIMIFLGIVLYLRYLDVKKRKNENSMYDLYKLNSI